MTTACVFLHSHLHLACHLTVPHPHLFLGLVARHVSPVSPQRVLRSVITTKHHIPSFELYERNHGRGKSDKEYSIKLSLSEGAHSSNVLDSALDARHSLNVQPRRKLTQHLPYPLVIERLSKHFGRVMDDDDTGPDTPFETIDALQAPVASSAPADDP